MDEEGGEREAPRAPMRRPRWPAAQPRAPQAGEDVEKAPAGFPTLVQLPAAAIKLSIPEPVLARAEKEPREGLRGEQRASEVSESDARRTSGSDALLARRSSGRSGGESARSGGITARSGSITARSSRSIRRLSTQMRRSARRLVFPDRRTLFIFTKQSALRRAAEAAVGSALWEYCGMAVIVFNTVVLALSNPLCEEGCATQDALDWGASLAVTVYFTLELAVNAVARGLLLHPGAVLRDFWGCLDAAVVVLGWASMSPALGNLTSLRAFRLLRFMRTLTFLPSLRLLFRSLQAALPLFAQVLASLAAFLLVFGIVGVHLFAGAARVRPLDALSGSLLEGDDFEYPRTLCSDSPGGGGVAAPPGAYCGPARSPTAPPHANPTFGYTNLDNVFFAFLTIFQCVTLSQWSTFLCWYEAALSVPAAVVYFLALVLAGAFLVVQLLAAVLTEQYRATEDEGKAAPAAAGPGRLGSIRRWLDAAEPGRPGALREACGRLLASAPFFLALHAAVLAAFVASAVYPYSTPAGTSPALDARAAALDATNAALTAFFLLESALRLAALGPRAFLARPAAAYALLAALCSLAQCCAGGRALSGLLHVPRLLRGFELLAAGPWAPLRLLLKQTLASLLAAGQFLPSLVLFVFLATLFGRQLFAGSMRGTDGTVPRASFDSLFEGALSVAQIVTGDSWNDIMFLAMRGAGAQSGALTYLVPWYFIAVYAGGNWFIVNVFLSILLYHIRAAEHLALDAKGAGASRAERRASLAAALPEAARPWRGLASFLPRLRHLRPGAARTAPAPPLNGRPGADADDEGDGSVLGIGSSLAPAPPPPAAPDSPLKPPPAVGLRRRSGSGPAEAELPTRPPGSLRRLEPAGKEPPAEGGEANSSADPRPSVTEPRPSVGAPSSGRASRRHVPPSLSFRYRAQGPPLTERASVRRLLSPPSSDGAASAAGSPAASPRTALAEAEAAETASLPAARRACRALVRSAWFERAALLLVLGSCVIAGMEGPRLAPERRAALRAADLALLAAFALEAVLRAAAWGLLRGRRAYLRSPWNLLDLGVVLLTAAAYAAEASAGTSSLLRAFRGVRALRPLRLVARLSGLRHVVAALAFALPATARVTAVALLVYYVFAQAAHQLFAGRLVACTDPAVFRREDCVGSFLDARTRTAQPRLWHAYRASYDSVGRSMLTLFEVSTLERWSDYMRRAMDATGYGTGPARDAAWPAAFFFLAFVVLATFFVLQMFVGVVVDAFRLQKEATEIGQQGAFLTPAQRQWRRALAYAVRVGLRPRVARPASRPRALAFDLVRGRAFDAATRLLVALSVLSLCLYTADTPPALFAALEAAHAAFAAAFLLEAALRMAALGPRVYLADPWLAFDGAVALALAAAVVAAGLIPTRHVVALRALRALRLARAVRFAARLPSLRLLLQTFIACLPSLANVGTVLLVVFFAYGVLGVAAFGTVVRQGALTDYASFEGLPVALLTLARISTGENWNDLMYACSLRPEDAGGPDGLPACTDGVDCGSRLAPLYFVSFLLVGTLVMLNLFVAIVIEAFAESAAQRSYPVSEAHIDRFLHEWEKMDPSASETLDVYGDFPELLRRVGPPLGVPPAASRPALLRFIRDLDLPVSLDGRVHFFEAMKACVDRVYAASAGALPDRLRFRLEAASVRNFPRLRRQLERPEGWDLASAVYAARRVQRQWRVYVLRRRAERAPGPAPAPAAPAALAPPSPPSPAAAPAARARPHRLPPLAGAPGASAKERGVRPGRPLSGRLEALAAAYEEHLRRLAAPLRDARPALQPDLYRGPPHPGPARSAPVLDTAPQPRPLNSTSPP